MPIVFKTKDRTKVKMCIRIDRKLAEQGKKAKINFSETLEETLRTYFEKKLPAELSKEL